MSQSLYLSTKKYSHNLKVQGYFIWWDSVQDSEPRKQYLSTSEKTAPRRQKGKSGYIQVCNKGSRQSEQKRSGIKEFSILCMGRCQPLGSLNLFLSYAPQLSGPILFPCSPCFLHSPSSSAITVGGGSSHWITVLGALIHIWRPGITDGCDVSYLLLWQEICSFYILKLKKIKNFF